MQAKQHLVEQGSEVWFELRMGRFTASTFKDLFSAKTTAGYQKAIYSVVFERLTGESPENFQSDYMKRGNELEPLAREAYELEKFVDVEDGGFWTLGDWIGASPDGLVGDDGLLEIKCPAFNTMIGYLLKGTLPTTYKWQVQGQLYVTDRKWCDFMAYHPKLKTMILRIERDEKMIKDLEATLEKSIAEAKDVIEKLK